MTGTNDEKTGSSTDARTMRTRRSNRRVGIALAGLVVGMVGVSYAAVPLYELFCAVTGFGGTTRQAEAAPGVDPGSDVTRTFTVRFDSNVNGALDWEFEPAVRTTEVEMGVEALAFYRATNTSDKPVVGTATFNVTPHKAGPYFMKIDCFCFTEQVLAPGQSMDMPVQFFLDPELMEDRKMDGVTTVTLSYTFYPAEDQSKAQQLALAPSVR